MKPNFLVQIMWAVLILPLWTSQPQAKEDLPELIKKLKPAIVQVNCYDKEDKLFKNGSGFFISKEGYLITARYLLLGGANVRVKTWEGQEYPIKLVVAEDLEANLVRVLVERPPEAPTPFLPVTATLPETGERVLVMGSTKKAEFTMTDGMVSGFRDFLQMGKVMQLTAHLNSAIHGGPLMNLKGEVAGVACLGKFEGQDFPYGIPAARILALKTTRVQTFPEWAAGHVKEATDYYVNKAVASLKANRWEEAQSFYRSAVRIKPDDAELRVQLGLALLKDNKNREALEAFGKALEIKSDHAPAHYQLGLLYVKLNNQAEARKELETLKKLDAALAGKLQASLQPPAKGAGETTISELVKKVQPAVVFITVYNKQGKSLKIGSGFFINAKGHFVTNYHVLVGGVGAKVKTFDGKVYPVTRVLSEDKAADLMVGAIVPEVEMPYLPVTGVLPEVGDRVVVVGNPKGLEWSVADGIVSAVRTRGENKKFVQISAPISPGSSGGPAINLKGEAIGVNTFYVKEGQLLNFSSSSQNILALKPGPGLTMEERADGWREEAKDLVRAGRQHMKNKAYPKAVDVLEDAANIMPDLAEAHYELCLAYVTVGNEDGAAKELQTLKQLDDRMANELVRKLKAMSR